MEAETGFDLNASIANWRQGLAAHESFDAETLRELESHLREGVDGLAAKGLSREEAFWLAARRIGGGKSLADEFQKADPLTMWRRRLFWMLLGVAGLSFLSSLFQTFSFVLAAISSKATASDGRGSLMYVRYFTFFAGPIAALFFCRWILLGRAQGIFERLRRIGISRLRIAMGVANALTIAHCLQFFGSTILVSEGRPNFGWKIFPIFAALSVFPIILGSLIAYVAPLPTKAKVALKD